MRDSGHNFALFRILLGTYLVVHFTHLLPYAPELWSNAGMLPDPTLLPAWGKAPDPLFFFDAPSVTRLLVALLALAAVLFALGVWRRVAAVVLWLGWLFLFNRNPLIANPSLPYVGWLLLASAVIPEGEPWALAPLRPAATWRMPPALYWGGLALLMVGYTVSGLHKLSAPSWRDGTAFFHVLEIPLARDTALRASVAAAPPFVFQFLTWSALAVEISAGPVALLPRTRPFGWLAAVGLQLGILCFVAFADLTLGMLLAHAFVFDRRWVPGRRSDDLVVFFDGVCGFSNASVDFIIAEDQRGRIRFAPLQGETAQQAVGPLTGDPDSIVVQEGGHIYRRSAAAVRIMTALGGVWRPLGILLGLVPRPLRDLVYDWITRNRYRRFGKRDTCRLPTLDERPRFIP
jgi:predicted DCC family thiol-disulfide oxidoreductase YuxK